MKTSTFRKWILPYFLSLSLTSCSASSYQVYHGNEHVLNLTVTDSFQTSYQSGDKITFEGLVVTFDDVTLSSSQYYLTTEPTKPRENKIAEGDEVSTSGNKNAVSLYAAYDVEDVTYVSSQSATIEANSSKSFSPIVYYVSMGVVIVAVGVWLFIRAKAKKEGRA